MEEQIKIYHGNCLELIQKIPDNSIDMILTDPPYKITPKGCSGNSGGMMTSKLTMTGKIFEHNDIEFKDYISELYRVLKDGSHCYIMTNHVNLKEFLVEAENVAFKFIKSLIWDKGNKIMGCYYMSQFEYILFFRKGYGKQINNCGTPDILNVQNKKTRVAGENIHDTEKPVELMEILIKNSSNRGETVLDCFMGSGSTALACINSDRKFIGFELDQTYFNVSKDRIKNHLLLKQEIERQISLF